MEINITIKIFLFYKGIVLCGITIDLINSELSAIQNLFYFAVCKIEIIILNYGW